MKILHGQSIFVCTSCFGLKLILRQKKQRSEEILRLWSGFFKIFFRAVCHVSHLFLFGKTHVIYRMIKYLLLQTQNSSKTTQGFSPGSWGPTEDKVWKIPSSDWTGCVGGRPTFVDTDKRMNVVFVTGFFFSPFSHLLNAGPGTVTSWRRHGACSAPEFWKKWMFAPFFAHIRVFWAIFRGFPTTLVMCAAGDGGHATLILLPGSGKYPASLCRRKTTKSWVWLRLQPPGLAAPAEHVQESQPAPIFPRMTLSSLLPHAFSPRPQPVKETCVSLDVLWTEWPGDGDTSSMVT